MTTSFTHDSSHLAETYDRLSDSQFEGGKRLVERLDAKPGDRVLDVGSGTGRLARWIAERVGPTGSVVGIDPLPDRVAIARANAPGVAFEVGRAEDLTAFADESFDVVCMSAVFHWVDDKKKALAEVRRVLRPGGRLGITTLPRELLMAGTVATVLAPLLGQAPYAPSVDLSKFVLASHGLTTSDLLTLIVESQLRPLELHVMARTRSHARGADVVDFLESSSFGNFLRIVPDELRPSLRTDLSAAFDARAGSDGAPGQIVLHDWGTVLVARKA
jgi:ubiquinone/menaquinone biosynthesis C-methylase UbiE